MIKKCILILAITAVLLSSGVVFATNLHTGNGLNLQSNPVLQYSSFYVEKSGKTVDVVKSTRGKVKTAHKGHNITIKYVILDKGIKPIYNVVFDDQYIHKNLGTIKPGETRQILYTECIHPDKEIKDMHRPNSEITNPYPMDGAHIYYKGIKHIKYFEIFKIN